MSIPVPPPRFPCFQVDSGDSVITDEGAGKAVVAAAAEEEEDKKKKVEKKKEKKKI